MFVCPSFIAEVRMRILFICLSGFLSGGPGGGHSSPLGSLSSPLGTGRFVNDNSSLMYGYCY